MSSLLVRNSILAHPALISSRMISVNAVFERISIPIAGMRSSSASLVIFCSGTCVRGVGNMAQYLLELLLGRFHDKICEALTNQIKT